MGCDFAQLLQNSKQAALPVAVAPNWPRADFVQAALSLSARLQAGKCRSAALWFDDAARFACALAAISVTDFGVTTALHSKEQVLALMAGAKA